ncbi:MAG: sigma-70 family RNA polymerase sigma factor [Chitinophagaceae bacterium]|nr:sigma-70 family RNA polymerase sigma factor [Chitinophagaceae bacterium]
MALDNPSNIEQTVEHLFRHEWGKLVTVLTKLFGPQNLQMAEDVVQDTLVKALNTWKINGLPENPSAWLFTAARNKAVDLLRQQKRKENFSKNMTPLLQSEYTLVPTVREIINTNSIDDDQLRMMFVCCHPSLSAEAQVALILKTLCGFSVTEIAKAFVSSYDSIEKRLYRARQSFRDNAVSFELPPEAELKSRIDNVLIAVYLLFNEGYNSTSHEDLVRNDLIYEAMRLCDLICRSTRINHYGAHALMALICFTAARNDARLDDDGNILLLKEQDRSKWNRDLILKGISYLEACAAAEEINKYHLEAVIAYEHATAVDYASTNWKNILHYYDVLLQLNPSPVVELNRAVVIGELNGPAACIEAINSISQISSLKKYYLLPATLGEMHRQLKDYDTANAYFEEAIKLTQSASEKKLLQQKIKGR